MKAVTELVIVTLSETDVNNAFIGFSLELVG